MEIVTYTAVRANLAKTMDEVCDSHDPVVITRSNAEPTVLLSLKDYEAMQEINYLLQSPKNAKRLAESIDEIEAMIEAKQKRKKKA